MNPGSIVAVASPAVDATEGALDPWPSAQEPGGEDARRLELPPLEVEVDLDLALGLAEDSLVGERAASRFRSLNARKRLRSLSKIFLSRTCSNEETRTPCVWSY